MFVLNHPILQFQGHPFFAVSVESLTLDPADLYTLRELRKVVLPGKQAFQVLPSRWRILQESKDGRLLRVREEESIDGMPSMRIVSQVWSRR